MNSAAEVSLKRYRYTGKERDEETGLYYHGARYYAAWVGRWATPDPSGLNDGVNLYACCSGNPLKFSDLDGRAGRNPTPQEVKTLAERGMTASWHRQEIGKPKANPSKGGYGNE